MASTGEIEEYAYGQGDRDLALAEAEGYDLENSYAYSDSVTDEPMLARWVTLRGQSGQGVTPARGGSGLAGAGLQRAGRPGRASRLREVRRPAVATVAVAGLAAGALFLAARRGPAAPKADPEPWEPARKLKAVHCSQLHEGRVSPSHEGFSGVQRKHKGPSGPVEMHGSQAPTRRPAHPNRAARPRPSPVAADRCTHGNQDGVPATAFSAENAVRMSADVGQRRSFGTQCHDFTGPQQPVTNPGQPSRCVVAEPARIGSCQLIVTDLRDDDRDRVDASGN